MATIGTIELIATIDTSKYKQGVKEIDKANSDIESSANKSSKNMSDSFSSAAKMATTAVLAAGALMVKSFVESGSKIQSLRASFESLTGNVEDTNAVMTTLYGLGLKTAFRNEDIQSAGRSFLATGVAVKDLGSLLSQTADIAGATGADLGQLTRPLTQAISKGKLDTQDFYQIMDAGAGALRKPLSDLAGSKGFGNLADALAKSAITSDDLLKVMQDVTKEGGFAFGGAIKQSETFAGRMSNLQESITNVGLGMLGVDAITGEIDPSGPFAIMSDAVSSLTGFLSENGEMIKQIATIIGIFLTPAIIMLGVQGLIAGGKLLAGMLMALGPIGLIIAAVAAAAYLIISNWEAIKKVAGGVWEWIKNAVVGVFNWIKNNWPLLLAIISGPLGLAVYAIIKNFDTIKGAVGKVWEWIKGVFGTIGSVAATIIKTPVNAILGFAENTVNGFINLLNGVVGIINKIPGVNLKKIGTLSFPRLAEGGIVSSATLAMIGEGKEPEAVIPLSKLDKMLGNSSTSNSNLTININMSGVMTGSASDERAVARRLVERLNEELKSKGMAELAI